MSSPSPVAVTAPVDPTLAQVLRSIGPTVVAFSGGADSAYLAWAATEVLGRERVLCVTAVSPSLADAELGDCVALARRWDLRWCPVVTDEADDPRYLANSTERCFYCKAALMAVLEPIAVAERATVVLGVNLDDLGEHRPGQRAAAAGGARFPLVDAGCSKARVRAESRRLGLPTWDKPAAPCLASRIPYGTPVTLGTLQAVAQAEAGLRALGFHEVRVRHYGDLARVEVPVDDLARALAQRQAVLAAVRAGGYRYVTVDLDGLRSGNLNGAAGLSVPEVGAGVGLSGAPGRSGAAGPSGVPGPWGAAACSSAPGGSSGRPPASVLEGSPAPEEVAVSGIAEVPDGLVAPEGLAAPGIVGALEGSAMAR